jgi:type IV pilus assembly protein PilY1
MKSLHGILKTLLVASLGATMACGARAEDIDIYTVSSGSATDIPNVLLMVDNTANWSSNLGSSCYYNVWNEATKSWVAGTEGPKATNPGIEQGTKMGLVKCALYNTILALKVKADVPDAESANFNVGIMLLNESPSSNNGAYPRVAMLPLTAANKATMLTAIKAMALNDDKGNNGAFAKAMYEMYLYFKGSAPYKGAAGLKYDSRAFVSGVYNSPAPASCANNHIIFIGNGSPQGAENNDALALLTAAGGSSSPLKEVAYSLISKSEQETWAPEFAFFMRQVDISSKDGAQSIMTHAVAVTGSSNDGTFPAYMESLATAGGGVYVAASNAQQLATELTNVFNAINSKNQVFAAASLPVAVNARGTYLNQVYMGVFRPDGDAKQRWRGNLKQYQFAADSSGNLSMVDSKGANAINGATGFILPSAVSFWTTASTFWTNEPMGDTTPTSDSPDGEMIHKGGAAQRLRETYGTSQAARNVYTCIGCTPGTVLSGNATTTKFAVSNTTMTPADFGLSTDAQRDTLIEWLRGTDNAGDEKGPGSPTTIRPSVHGDVLHSRPAVINYGNEHGVVVFYGANDGMLHALDGNRTGSTPGEELWSFVPQEMFPRLNRLRTNTPEISLTTTVLPGAKPRDYYVDGPIGVYQRIAADGSTSEATIFVSMRRGGRALYAFDVKTPTSPQLRWKFAGSDTNKNMGQSWSEPKVGRVIGDKATAAGNLVVMFGGGYDPAEDDLVPGTTTMGAAVFILDATTGTVLKEFNSSHGLTRPIVADLAVVDSDFDGKIDRAYAMDLGGGVWRIDFETADGKTSKDDWTIFKVADLSGGTTTGRKFFYAPSVVLTKDFTALMFGSGDREKPLLQTTKDHFFTVFDRNLDKGKPSTLPTPIAFDKLSPMTPTPTTLGDGCQMELAAGEKVVNGATTIGGKTHFGTNQPIKEGSTNTCIPHLGTARGYTMPLFCTAPTHTVYPGGGLPPSPIAGTVTITSADGKSSSNHHFYTGGDQACGALCPSDPKIKITAARKRIYWYQQTNR